MQLEPEQTPDRYRSISCVYESNEGHIKVFRNGSHSGDVYFHIACEPDMEDINGPEDIETLYAFSVGKNETESFIKRDAVRVAKQLARVHG